MTIDASIYVLSSDGTIQKFTRGKKDTFTVSGLSKPFSSPKAILTSEDLTSLYVLDPGSSRIVVLAKTGVFQTQFSSDVIKTAKAFDVSESSKKLYILSGGKVYAIPMK